MTIEDKENYDNTKKTRGETQVNRTTTLSEEKR